MKVQQLRLLLIDISTLPKILDNISVIVSTKKYDNHTSLRFSSHTNLGTAKGFINFTKLLHSNEL